MSMLRVASRVHQAFGAAAAGIILFHPGPASAHVKWFCVYDIAGQPAGLENVLCQDFELLTGFAIAVLLMGCLLENTFVGVALSARSIGSPELAVQYGHAHSRGARLFPHFTLVAWRRYSHAGIDDGLAADTPSATVDGGVPLSPKTMPFAAAGLVFLFGDGVVHYGLFHMMDYPIFVSLAAYLAATGLKRDIFGFSPLDVLRWSVAITLMWASVEKWAYPEWSYPLFISHPGLSMGYEPAFFMRAAGVVEFTLSFALICTPLARRAASVMLIATFVSAIAEFGKIDAVGHSPIIITLIAIFADQTQAKQRSWSLAALPLQYGGALATFVALYYFGHAIAFGTPLS